MPAQSIYWLAAIGNHRSGRQVKASKVRLASALCLSVHRVFQQGRKY